MKTQLLAALISANLMGTLVLTNMAILSPQVLCMEKDEQGEDIQAHSPFLKIRTHPKNLTWSDMAELMSSVSFEKVNPKNITGIFEHRLENEGYYFTIRCARSLRVLFNNYAHLSFRLDLIQEPSLVGLDTQLIYEIIVIGGTAERRVTDFLVSYVHESVVKVAAHVPLIKILQRKRSRKARKRFAEGPSPRMSVLTEESQDLRERTKRSERNAQEAKQQIDAYYATLGSPRPIDTKEVSSPSEESSSLSSSTHIEAISSVSSSAHSSPKRSRSRILDRVRANSEEEKIEESKQKATEADEKSKQKATEAIETIGAYFSSLGSTPRRLRRSIAKTEYHDTSDESANASDDSLSPSSGEMSDSPENPDDSDSNSFE